MMYPRECSGASAKQAGACADARSTGISTADILTPLSTTAKRTFSTSSLRTASHHHAPGPLVAAVSRALADNVSEHMSSDGCTFFSADTALTPNVEMDSGVSGRNASYNYTGYSPALIGGTRGDVCLLDPIAIHHQVSQWVSSERVSPFARSRSCESAWVMLDYGVTAEQGVRRTMEDQHTMLAEGIPFFGVYDGHGGTQCAEYLRDNLHTLILSHPEIKTNPEKAITDGILEADRRFLEVCMKEKIESGSVCAVALFVHGNLVVGNVGDAEAVLCRGGQAVPLTVSHNPKKNAREAERVVAAGGRLFHNRVGHPKFNPTVISLAVSRALGDVGFKLSEFTDGKPSGVIAVPDTTSIKLTPEDEFLLIGCDGLWDVFPHADAINFCRNHLHAGLQPSAITEKLVDEALAKGTTDNITVAFISCKPTAGQLCINASFASDGVSPRLSSVTSVPAMVMKHSSSSCGFD